MEKTVNRGSVVRVEWVTEQLVKVQFVCAEFIPYQAGQFLSVLLPGVNKRQPEQRYYSLSSAPFDTMQTGVYEFIAKVEQPSSLVARRYFKKLKAGSSLWFEGPYGEFVLSSPHAEKDVVFIATSAQVGPCASMIRSLGHHNGNRKDTQSPRRSVLLYGVRNESEVLFRESFELQGTKVVPCVTEPTQLLEGFWGRVTELLRRDILGVDWANTVFYISSTPDTIADTLDFLRNTKGVPEENIKFQTLHTESMTANGAVVPLELVRMSGEEDLDMLSDELKVA